MGLVPLGVFVLHSWVTPNITSFSMRKLLVWVTTPIQAERAEMIYIFYPLLYHFITHRDFDVNKVIK